MILIEIKKQAYKPVRRLEDMVIMIITKALRAQTWVQLNLKPLQRRLVLICVSCCDTRPRGEQHRWGPDWLEPRQSGW